MTNRKPYGANVLLLRGQAVATFSDHLAWLLCQDPLPAPEQVGEPYREVLTVVHRRLAKARNEGPNV